MQQYGHVLRKDDGDWVKKCITLEVEGAIQRVRSKKTQKEVVDEDMEDMHRKLGDTVDHCKSGSNNSDAKS